MKQIEQTGKTISEAVESACIKLGVGLSDVEYEVLDEGSKGFLGIGARPAKVIVRCETLEEEKAVEPVKPVRKPMPETQKEVKEVKKEAVKEVKPVKAAEPEVQQTAEPEVQETQSERASLTDEDKAAIIKVAVDFLSDVLGCIDMDIKFETDLIDNKQVVINMIGEDMGTIIGKRGQTLDSLQYLTNLVVNKGEYPYMNVSLDTEGYRARRKETLEHLAFNLAKKAKHNRRNVNLEPMNPYERRIIHATLQNDRYVTTYSEGVEPYRYVVIALKNSYTARKNHY